MKINKKQVSNFKVIELTERKLKKESLFDEIKKIEPKILNILNDSLKEKNKVYAYKFDKKIRSIYIIDGKDNVLKLIEYYNVEEMTKEAIESVEEIIVDSLKEYVAFGYYNELEFKNIKIEQNQIVIGKKKLPLGIVVDFVIVIVGLIIDDILNLDMWYVFLMLGTIIGLSYGVIVKDKKRNR